MEVLVVLWIALGITCAAIASNKGRSVVAWFVLGVLFGPFALIVIAVSSRNDEAKSRAGLQSGAMRKCPFCAELVRSEATLCRHCGSALPPPPKMDIWGRVKS